ncbi:MAG: hypothetical protein DMF69_01345 [Acidobacteria bacterium]|nr:MAG: hypothetical protein DMF69_01345 [Acidobacteriota bacterium]
MTPFNYTAYGLQFASSIPLPGLQPSTNCEADITINYGEVPVSLPLPSARGVAWQSAPGKFLVSVSEVARYLIVKDREILIQPLPGSNEDDVCIFLLGSVLGALLHARHMLVLHASAVETKHGAVIFMGRSGAGKSTTLAAFLQRGYTMVADDKAGIVLDKHGIAQVMPGFPLARLTEETIEALDFSVQGARHNHELKKYLVPVERFCTTPLKVHAAYSLNVHNLPETRLHSMETVEQFQVLNRHTYRRRFLYSAGQKRKHFETLAALSTQTRVVRVWRPDSASRIADLVNLIEQDLER